MALPLYNPNTILGNSFQRTKKIIIDNPHVGIPVIEFQEEIIYIFPNSYTVQPLDSIYATYDPTVIINVINPKDGSSLGTMPIQMVYAIVYSYYLQCLQFTLPQPPIQHSPICFLPSAIPFR